MGGRSVFYWDAPPTPQASKYYQKHRSGGEIPQSPGCTVGQSQGRPTRHLLEPPGRWEVSEGSMSLMVSINLDAERSRRGGEGMGE